MLTRQEYENTKHDIMNIVQRGMNDVHNTKTTCLYVAQEEILELLNKYTIDMKEDKTEQTQSKEAQGHHKCCEAAANAAYKLREECNKKTMTLEEAIQDCLRKVDLTLHGRNHMQMAEWLQDYKAILEEREKVMYFLNALNEIIKSMFGML